ncbi:hypothetical protein Tco_1514211, partial [Tanacetum coccineum]
DSEAEFIPNVEDKTVRPGTEKIKFVKSFRETVEKVETLICTDNAKITRKRSKPDKHGHGNGKSTKEPEVSSKSAKEAQRGLTHGMPRWQSVCSSNQSNGHNMDPMIGKDSRDEINSRGACKESLDHSSQAYK